MGILDVIPPPRGLQGPLLLTEPDLHSPRIHRGPSPQPGVRSSGCVHPVRPPTARQLSLSHTEP